MKTSELGHLQSHIFERILPNTMVKERLTIKANFICLFIDIICGLMVGHFSKAQLLHYSPKKVFCLQV